MKSNKGNNLERINIVYIRNVTLCHIVTLHALYSNLQIRVLFLQRGEEPLVQIS